MTLIGLGVFDFPDLAEKQESYLASAEVGLLAESFIIVLKYSLSGSIPRHPLPAYKTREIGNGIVAARRGHTDDPLSFKTTKDYFSFSKWNQMIKDGKLVLFQNLIIRKPRESRSE
jgi:hypothetical protein